MTRQFVIVFIMSLILFFIQASHAENTASKTPACRCLPDQPCWPDKATWKEFSKTLTGRVLQPNVALDVCVKDVNSKDCSKVLKAIHNPFHNENVSGGTQSQGWMDAWTNQPSAYAVEAANAEDVAASVNFAREH